MLTAILSYQLETELGVRHFAEGSDIVNAQWDPWIDADLKVFKKKWKLVYPLRPWDGDLPWNWLDQWGTTFPYPIKQRP